MQASSPIRRDTVSLQVLVKYIARHHNRRLGEVDSSPSTNQVVASPMQPRALRSSSPQTQMVMVVVSVVMTVEVAPCSLQTKPMHPSHHFAYLQTKLLHVLPIQSTPTLQLQPLATNLPLPTFVHHHIHHRPNSNTHRPSSSPLVPKFPSLLPRIQMSIPKTSVERNRDDECKRRRIQAELQFEVLKSSTKRSVRRLVAGGLTKRFLLPVSQLVLAVELELHL